MVSRSVTSGLKNQHAAIARAKQEWECIADALPQLICLLSKEGQVIRTNLVVERWSIGNVRNVLGLSVHDLFHRNCGSTDCYLRAALALAWQKLPQTGAGEFAIVDGLLHKVLNIKFRLLPDLTDANPSTSSNFAIVIATDVTELHAANEGQRVLNEELEMRVRNRTAELSNAVRKLKAEVTRRELAETSLRTSRNELCILSEQLMKAQENERKRIAADLHDAVGQSLSAIKYSLERALQMLASPKLGSPIKLLNKTVEHVQDTIEEVRLISENLRPALLDGLGAVSAIRWFCREWGDVFSGVAVEMNLHVTDADIQEPLGTTLFRTVQESLTNVARHSKATRAVVSVSREANQLCVEIADNGTGFDTAGNMLLRGHGLRGMRERVTSTGGNFSLNSSPGAGTRLTLLWSLPSIAISEDIALCGI